MTNPSPFTVGGISWWKPTPDTIAAYLTLDQSKRLLAGSALQAPEDWQRKAKVTLGERLGRLLGGVARATVSVGTIGLSEVMYRLSQPGQLAAAPNIPALDLVVGPNEAAILIVDGAVVDVLTADRARTHDFWDQLSTLVSRGPHLEVVMLDLSPSALTVPLTLEIAAEEVSCKVDAEVAFDRMQLKNALRILSRIRLLREGDLNAPVADGKNATFASAGTLAQLLQRRLQHKAVTLECAKQPAATLRRDPVVLAAAQAEIARFLNEELLTGGLAVQRCHLLVGRSAAEELEIRRRNQEIVEAQRTLLDQATVFELRRQQELDKERQAIGVEQGLDQQQGKARLEQSAHGHRFAMARMVLQNEQELAILEREGFAKRRESERLQDQLDFQHKQMLAAQANAQRLEQELAGAKNQVEIERLKMQLETERLKVAALAQEQNLTNLRRLKEIEREDALLRQNAAADRERARFAAAGSLSPEQMLAAMADGNPEIAKALAAKFAADGTMAQRSAAEKIELMQKMQADMTSIMREGLSANAQVARGLVQGAAPMAMAECRTCHSKVQPQWKACPYCGNAL